jgi:hypothetical protein
MDAARCIFKGFVRRSIVFKGGKEVVDICSSLIRRLGNYHRVACCHIRFVWSYLVAATYEDIGTKSNHTKCDERTDDVANNV